MTLYVPIIFGKAIDNIADDGVNLGMVVEYLVKAGIIVVAASVLQWIMNLINNRITFETVRDIRDRAFKKSSSAPEVYRLPRPRRPCQQSNS